VRLRGRVSSLLEVGTGFHPELTGRENIYLNGIILGMSREEVRRKFDEIVAFAEVERFLDTPVKRYSSGMYVRLAFAVAAHLEPEILLVDEVLAVGDAAFQRKSLGKMRDVAESGRTILLVSHNMAAITQLCTSAIWLDRGRLRAYGSPQDVIDSYTASFTALAHGEFVGRVVGGDGTVELLSYSVENAQGTSLPLPVTNEDITITLRVRVKEPIGHPALNISLWNAGGMLMTSVNSVQTGAILEPWEAGERDVSIILRQVPYMPGDYRADIWLMNPQGHIYAYVEDAVAFEIGQSPLYGTSHITPGYGSVYTNIDYHQR
jgi:lipopolysaccharide transport system ATP-binding protein